MVEIPEMSDAAAEPVRAAPPRRVRQPRARVAKTPKSDPVKTIEKLPPEESPQSVGPEYLYDDFVKKGEIEIKERADLINNRREQLGFPRQSAAELVAADLETAWFDDAETPYASTRRRVLNREINAALSLYGLPESVVDLEELRNDRGDERDDVPLAVRIAFAEEIRDHLRQIIDYEHTARPERVPFTAREMGVALMRYGMLKDAVEKERRAIPLLRRLFRPQTELERLLSEQQSSVFLIDQTFNQYLLANESPDMEAILKKGLESLQKDRRFKKIIEPFITAVV